MVDPEVAKLLSDLQKWCDVKRGRRAYIARIIGVPPRRISDWFAGRILPSLAMGLRVKTFLDGQKPKKEKASA